MSQGRTHLVLAGAGTSTAALGLRLALADGNPLEVLAWSERRRTAPLRLAQPAATAADLTEYLGRLRRVTAALSTVDDFVGRILLLRRQRAIEGAIGRIASRLPMRAEHRRPVTEIVATLADHVLVELVTHDGAVAAVVVRDGRAALRSLGSAVEISDEARSLRFAHRRLTLGQGTSISLVAARAAARHAAARLDAMIFHPIRDLTADRPLVLVPTGDLYGLAWPALPSCRGRAVQVAPSARVWCAGARGRAGDGRHGDGRGGDGRGGDSPGGRGNPGRTGVAGRPGHVVLVAPDTPRHAAMEVAAIGRARPDATLLTGVRARVTDVLAALDGACIGHLAAHGRFRPDNPLFSQLTLADGALTVQDLSQLRRPPRLLVLSACDAGRSGVRGDDDVMGFTSSMLALGSRAVVASVGPVDDEATARLMVDLHRRLRAGSTPAEALAAAQVATASEDWSSAHSFVCFGRG